MTVRFQYWLALSALLLTSLRNDGLAFDMTRADLTRTLYSNQLAFDRNGQPLVSVRISESQTDVSLRTQRGIVLMPSNQMDERIELDRASKWRFTVEDKQPAHVRIWLALGSLRAQNFKDIKSLKQRAKSLGLSPKRFESGSVIGLKGTTLDTRQITLAIGPFQSKDAAEAKKAEFKQHFGSSLHIYEELVKPAQGIILATESRSGLRLRVRNVLWLESLTQSPLVFDALEWGQGTPKSGIEKRSYDGRIYITIGRDGGLAVVNVLSAEKLLEGVVPSELYPSAPMDALKAQAVAARGQLLAKIGTRHLADPYLLCAETHCQVYTGRARLNKRTSRAVHETQGELLFDSQGLVDTTYSSTCGGHTESSHLVWGGTEKSAHPGFVDTIDGPVTRLEESSINDFVSTEPEAFCKASGMRAKTYRWTKLVRGNRITKAIKKFKDIGSVYAFKVVDRGRSGRALNIEYSGTTGTVLVRGEYTNRKLLGHLKSGIWVATRVGGKADQEPYQWSFKGAGFGHGVGLCQHGAMGMAKQSYDWKRILKHYYKGSELRRAW